MLPDWVRRKTARICAVAALLILSPDAFAQASKDRIEAALTNIMTLHRPGQDGLATIWDGNKYIQCRGLPERALRCEAAGTLMQPSLGYVLSPEKIARLTELGWRLDTSFGNYVQTFPDGLSASQLAERILMALKDGYDANIANLEVLTDWIRSTPCPPRNGPSQNLAGMINDSRTMALTAVYGCAYKPAQDPGVQAVGAKDLFDRYAIRVSGELQRLRINLERKIFFALDTGGGYVQCAPQTSPQAIYCEAQSAESWALLARLLTPDRVARLHAAGFADPGRAPNYWKVYPLGRFTDRAIAEELLAILYDVYGYTGAPGLKFATEKGKS